MSLNSFLSFFDASNLTYLKNKYSKSIFKKIIKHKFYDEPVHLEHVRFIKKNVDIENFNPINKSIQDIQNNNFFIDSHIDEFFRANDFSIMLTKSISRKTVFEFLDVWFKKFIETDIFFKYPLENSIRLNHLIWYLQIYGDSLNKKENVFLINSIIYLTKYSFILLKLI